MKKILFTIIAIFYAASIGYSQVTTLWEKSATAGTKPAWETGSTTRGIGYGLVGANNRLFVVNRNAAFGGKQIFIFNATTGDSVGMLDTTGLAGGFYPVNDVEVSSNGIIYVGNMTLDATTTSFKVYAYSSEVAAPTEVINYTSATAMRLGDKITVTGSTADNTVTIWAAAANSTGQVVKFTTTDNGTSFTAEVISIGTLASFSSAAVGPLANGDFYFNAHGMTPQKFTSTGTLIGTIPSTAITTSGSALRHLFTFLGNEFVVANDLLSTNNNAKIINVPGGVPASATLFASTPVLGLVSAGGLGDVSFQQVSNYIYNVYVLATNNGFGAYQVDLRTPLAGDYYIPQGANPQGFATLNDAVASLNINGATGTVNFLLDADTLRENSFTFNASLSAANNVVVKPAPGRDVVLIVTPGVSKGNGIQMIGFDKGYVTIDGSNDGSDSRNLTITTDSTDTRVPIGLNTANADTITIKNLIIKNLDNVVTNFRYGIVTNDIGGIEGLTIENCQIGTSDRPVWRYGVAIWGDASNGVDATVINNEINSEGRGIATLYYGSCVFNNNFINMLPGAGTGSYTYNEGIYLSWGNYAEVHNNVINLLEKTTVPNAISKGISSASHPEGAVQSIVNNMINVGASDEAGTVRGIDFISASPHRSFKIYHNTIIVNEMTSTLVSYGITHTGTGAVDIDLKNNIIINNHSGNTGSSAIGLVPVTSVLVSDYNDLLSNQNLVNYQGTLYADLTAWQATTQDLNSVSKFVNFVSATDLHLTGSSNGDVDLAGTPIAGITTDIDGETRSAVFPYMGADEGSATIPVELTSFSANYSNGTVTLKWTTATETNNQGFEIQRKSNGDFVAIGQVNGNGTTTQLQSYSYTDNEVGNGTYSYRLKQIDFDGTFSYSNVIDVNVSVPLQFELAQNYPNPFNPTTMINYQIAAPVNVNLIIYSMLGEEVAVLINNQFTEAGTHSVRFDGSNLASGTYIYRLTAGDFVQTKKMMLTK